MNRESGPDLPPLVSTKMPQCANARLIALAPEMVGMIERLAEKVERANSLQHSRASHTIPAEDWSELFQLTNEARAILARIGGDPETARADRLDKLQADCEKQRAPYLCPGCRGAGRIQIPIGTWTDCELCNGTGYNQGSKVKAESEAGR